MHSKDGVSVVYAYLVSIQIQHGICMRRVYNTTFKHSVLVL